MARRVLDADGRRLRDEYDMRKFLADDETRTTYFERVDYVLAEFRKEGVDPGDAFVVKMVAQMVDEDDGFTSLVAAKNPADPDWKLLRKICAQMILEAHIKATEEGTWPVGN